MNLMIGMMQWYGSYELATTENPRSVTDTIIPYVLQLAYVHERAAIDAKVATILAIRI